MDALFSLRPRLGQPPAWLLRFPDQKALFLGMLAFRGLLHLCLSAKTDQKERPCSMLVWFDSLAQRITAKPRQQAGSYLAVPPTAGDAEVGGSGFPFSSFTGVFVSPWVETLCIWDNLFGAKSRPWDSTRGRAQWKAKNVLGGGKGRRFVLRSSLVGAASRFSVA